MKKMIEVIACDVCQRICRDDNDNESSRITVECEERKPWVFDICDDCFGKMLQATDQVRKKNSLTKFRWPNEYEFEEDDEQGEDK